MKGTSLGLKALAATALALAVGGPAAAAPAPDPASRAGAAADVEPAERLEMADAYLVGYDGDWFCPQKPGRLSVQLCPAELGEGGSSQHFAEYFIEHAKGNPASEPPPYMRVGKARRFCSLADWPGGLCATAVPARPDTPCADLALPPEQYAVTSPYCALRALNDLGIKLGVIVGAEQHNPDGKPTARSVAELTYHACVVNQADQDNLYDFMFLDQSFRLKDAELKDVVTKIQGGIYWNPAAMQYERCPAGGWPHLITNDTTYPQRTLATGAWAHAKRFDVLGRTGEPLLPMVEVATGQRPALTQKDLDFIRDVEVNDPGSHPILRFENPSQTDRLAQLGRGVQCQLLRRLAEGQQPAGYSMLYPFYVHAVPAKPRTYDSLFRGTFRRQAELIHNYNPDVDAPSFSPCPQPPA